MGPPSFATFERADGMNRQARNRRKFLLREAGRLPERLQVRAEWPRSGGGFHRT